MRFYGAIVLLLSATVVAEDEPTKGHWRYYPVEHGTPEIEVPSDEVLLKVVPPLRKEPHFSDEAYELGVALWWADHGQILFGEQPPTVEDLRREPVLRSPPGEDEPLVMCWWGLVDARAVSVVPKASPFQVTVRKVDFARRYVPTPWDGVEVEGGRVIGFASFIPEVGYAEGRKGENTVFWLNVHVPVGTAPGSYELPLDIIIHQVKQFEVIAKVEVLPFEVPAADIAYGMYFRGVGPGKFMRSRHATPEHLRKYWRDMARHGMTSISWYASYSGPDVLDEHGNVRPLNGHPAVTALEEMRDAGLIRPGIPIMWLGSNIIPYPESARQVQNELTKRGLPELLAYGTDEPQVNEEDRASFEAMRPLRKYMRNVTAINDHGAIAYADLIDVWVVHGGRITPALQELAAEKGAEIWTYDHTIRGHGNATRARFYAGLYTWALNLKGNYYWCYAEGFSWEGDRNTTHDFVLPSDSGPVPTVAWEARREGVEDYRLLRLLESRIKANANVREADEGRRYLDNLRSRVSWDLIQGMPLSAYPYDGPQVHPMCPNFEPAELSQIRERLFDYLLALP